MVAKHRRVNNNSLPFCHRDDLTSDFFLFCFVLFFFVFFSVKSIDFI